jgi:hypothetical protein
MFELELVTDCKFDRSYHGFFVKKTEVIKTFNHIKVVDECDVTQDMLWDFYENALKKQLKTVFIGNPDDEEMRYSVDYDGMYAYLFENSNNKNSLFPLHRIKIVEPTYVRLHDVIHKFL